MGTDDKFLDGAFKLVRGMVASAAGPPGLPRYAVGERLGEGAMAVVYRAQDRTLHRPVALKVLRESLAASEEGRARFVREAQAAAGLSHPNVVAVHDAGEHEGRPYLVMELVEGRPLADVLRERSLPLPSLLGLLEKAARGVAAAHEKGIVHRDLKPANILVTPAGEPKVADFGLARCAETEGALTATGTAIGTPLYMAPEQARGEAGDITPRTDVYALGAILYEALAGRPPHAGRNLFEIYGSIAHGEPVPPRKLTPGVPADMETICLKALEKDPARRYPTAMEFAEDVRRYLAGEPILARPAGPAIRAWRWVRKHRTAAAAVAAAAASALVFWALAGRGRDTEVARALVVQKRESARGVMEQWRREGRDTSALAVVLRDADRLIREEKLGDAAARLDDALAVAGLDMKVRELQQVARLWQIAGRDPSPIKGLVREAERLIREGKHSEAVEVLNRAATLPPSGLPDRIPQKMQAVQRGVEALQREGRDPSAVGKAMEEFEPLMRQGKHAEAEAVLDRALQLLQER